MLICKNGKIVVPKILQKYVVNLYHTYIFHPGTERTYSTISQHYYWPHLRDEIRNHIDVCNTCQKNKKKPLNMENDLLRKRRLLHRTDYR